MLTHWGRVTHICVSKLTIIGSDNGLAPDRRQAIIWTNAGMLLIRTLGTNFSEILSEIRAFSFKKMHLKMSSGNWRSFSLGLNVLKCYRYVVYVLEPLLVRYITLRIDYLRELPISWPKPAVVESRNSINQHNTISSHYDGVGLESRSWRHGGRTKLIKHLWR